MHMHRTHILEHLFEPSTELSLNEVLLKHTVQVTQVSNSRRLRKHIFLYCIRVIRPSPGKVV